MESLKQDAIFAIRTCRRSPMFTVTAVLTLALGIGANVTMFSIADTLLLETLPVAEPSRLVVVRSRQSGDFSYADYRTLRDGTHLAAALVGASAITRVAAGSNGESDQAYAKIASGNYFEGLGVRLFAGQTLAASDPLEPRAVVSYSYWTRRLGRSSSAIGSTLVIDGAPYMITGIAPPEFKGESPGESPDVWTSFALQGAGRYDAPGFSWLNLMARLAPGASPTEAASEFTALLTTAYTASGVADPSKAARVDVAPGAQGWSRARDQFAAPVVVLSVLVALLLLITCTNLAGLLLARGAARTPEIALRLALGGSLGRIARQLLTESLVLALPAGALGALFGVWALQALSRLIAPSVTGLSIDPDATRIVIFAAAASVLAAVLFGIAPAVLVLRRGRRAMAADDRRVIGGARRWGVREGLMAVQIALTFVLLAGSVMFARTLRNLETQDLGYEEHSSLLLGAIRPDRGYRPRAQSLVPDLLESIRGIPGVSAASIAFNGPLSFSGSGVSGLRVDGYDSADPQDLRARADWISPQYFQASGLRLVAGREFSDADGPDAPRVAVVNLAWARHYFRDGAAVGRRFTFNGRSYEVVGIAGDAKYTDLREPAPREVYFALLQGGGGPSTLQVRVKSGDPAAVAPAVREAVRRIDPRVHADELVRFEDHLGRKLSRESLLARLSGFFGTATLLLVSIAVYGAVGFAVAARSREVAIRLALGARRARVIWAVGRSVIVVTLLGAAAGATLAVLAGRFIGAMMFGFAAGDLVTMAVTAGSLLATTAVAAYLPARRAAGLDPAAVLRE
jgi:predicted permease